LGLIQLLNAERGLRIAGRKPGRRDTLLRPGISGFRLKNLRSPERNLQGHEETIIRKTVKGKVKAKGDVERERKDEGFDSRSLAEVGKNRTGKEEKAMASTVRVKGMSCQHCVMAVTKALTQLDGIQKVEVDLPKGEVRFENTKGLAANQIEKAIEQAGYQVEH